ncbi:MAG TPA: tetratricopeptide repeat protein [Gemmatimonadaceae bacterium]
MTRTGAYGRPDFDERTENIIEWAELHSKQLTIAAAVIVVIAAGGWFYHKSQAEQASNASAALGDAELALTAGNLPLAQSNLEKIVSRYGKTPSGDQARLLLAEVLYDNGRYEEGIKQLASLLSSDDKVMRASAYNLTAAGYDQTNKPAEAAAAYQKAAAAAAYPADRDVYLASAARALMDAGKSAEAQAIWQKLADDPSSPAASEAKIRLGEIEAKAAKQG